MFSQGGIDLVTVEGSAVIPFEQERRADLRIGMAMHSAAFTTLHRWKIDRPIVSSVSSMWVTHTEAA